MPSHSRPCAHCRKRFTPKKARQRFCGRSCSRRSRPPCPRKRTGEFRPCVQCGKRCYVIRSAFETFRFCSYKCNAAWHSKNNRVHLTCKICGKDFSVIRHRMNTARYCSRPCYYKGLAHSGSVEVPCDWCGKIVHKPPSHTFRKNFCSLPCRALGMSTFKQVFQRGACERCGWCLEPAVLVIHHKDRDKRNNAVSNLELLCWNCHMLEHFRAKDGPFHALARPEQVGAG